MKKSLIWTHKRLIKPLCKPPASLKGDLSYIEKKYFNFTTVYGTVINFIIASLIKIMLSGFLIPEIMVMSIIHYAVSIFILKRKAHSCLYGFFLISAFLAYIAFATSKTVFDAFFAPFLGLGTLWLRGASKKWLIIYFLFSFLTSWLFVQQKVVFFVMNAPREEIVKMVQSSFINMLCGLTAISCDTFFMVYVQEIIREKWFNMKKKIADQNEALQKSNEQLTKVIEERETFILSFSHETRNPLNGLLGNLHILSDMELPENVKKVVNKAQVCSKILKNIVLTILDSRKSGNSATNINLMVTPTNMRNFIEDVSMLCRDLIEGRGLLPIIEISPSFPDTIAIDPERIIQVIMNLVSNSIKFTQKGSIKLSFEWVPDSDKENDSTQQEESCMYLTACNKTFSNRFGEGNDHYNSKWFSRSTGKSPGTLKFAVTDTGSGIKKSHLDHIFEKFAQVDPNTEIKSLGLGLGLWISKAIVQLHKGQICVDSQEGSGSCFTVVIPTTTEATSIAACSSIASSSFEKTKPGSPVKVLSKFAACNSESTKALVIEDCAINQAINKAMLTKFGIQEVVVAQNGLEGVQIFKEKGPGYFDLITADLEMPVMKGKEAIMEIRKWEQEQNLPATKIIIISGNAVEREMQECLGPQGKIRADEFLTKPCDYTNLVKILNGLGIFKPAPNSSISKRKKILIADDDFFNLDIIQSFAAQLCVDCLSAKNGREAVQMYKLHADEIGIILLDKEMPVLNGIEACKEIRSLMRLKENQNLQPSLVLLSGHGKDQIPEQMFDQCIQKPMTFETFRKIISPLLQAHH